MYNQESIKTNKDIIPMAAAHIKQAMKILNPWLLFSSILIYLVCDVGCDEGCV